MASCATSAGVGGDELTAGRGDPPLTAAIGGGAADSTLSAGAGAAGESSSGSAGADSSAAGTFAESGSGGTAGEPDRGGSAWAGSAAGGNASVLSESSCLAGIANYKEKGPFRFDMKRSGDVNVWAPVVPSGCKVPIVHLGTGTGAQCSSYGAILEHLASHGFLATCYESPDAQGPQCVMAIETALHDYPELAAMKVGTTGHDHGGAAAIACVQFAEDQWGASLLIAGHAFEPEPGSGGHDPNYQEQYAKIKSPIFMFSGSEDQLTPAGWVRGGYAALNSEKYWYEAVGAPHVPVPTRWVQESSVVWFRWKLLGDETAGEYFRHMPNSPDWDLQEQAPAI